MPLVDDPTIKSSLFVPRGFIPLPGSDEETRPEQPKPEVEEPDIVPDWAPTTMDRIIAAGLGVANPLLSITSILSTNPTVQSAFRTENVVGSAIARSNDVAGVNNDLVDPNYSPWLDVVGTPYESYWKKTFAYSNNPQYTAALKSSIDRQNLDRRIVDASGVGGTISAMLAGTADPTILIPGGGGVSLAGKGVWTIARGAGIGAAAAGVGITAQELGLQASQDVRPVEESVFNVATGVVLGAVLGGTIAGSLAKTQRVGSEAALEKLANEQVPGSVGAAAPQRVTLDDLTIHGEVTNRVAGGTAFSPNLRGNFRESPLARQTYQELATNTLRQNMHGAGESLGGSVEDNILVSLGETLGQALERQPELFADGKKNYGMSADQFEEAIGRAMRRGDVGENDAVTAAAKMWRSTVIDPLTKQAIEMDLLPEGVKVTEAPSYFSRMYNQDKMIAKKPEFIEIARGHYEDILNNNYQLDAAKLREKQAEIDVEIAALKPKGKKKPTAEQIEKQAELRAQKAELDRKFYDKWEIRRLGEDVSPYNVDAVPNFSYHAKDMANETYDAITGQDWGSASVDPSINMAHKSGPLRDRTFHIPDEKIEPFLEDNVARVMTRFARSISAQIEMARKFPDGLEARMEEIKREYDALIDAADSEAARAKLEKDKKGTFRDLRALYEIQTGSYLREQNASSFGRVVRGLMNFNYIRLMGGSAIPSLSDLYNPAIFHDFGRSIEHLSNKVVKSADAIAGLKKEAKYAGVAERLAHHRLLTMAEIGDPYARGTAVERLLQSGTYVASKWNGLNMLTDFEKNFSATVVMDRMNEALLKGTDDQFLAYSGMGPAMRQTVKTQLEKFGEEIDGILIANTDQWENFNAVRAYRVAINRNINADIVTRGVGDVPLFAYHPLGKLLLQFKTFSLAAHQRTMLRTMQLGPAQFLSSMIGLVSVGMFAATLRALRGGEANWEKFKESSKNPGYMFAEGLDATGLFTLPLEIGNITEKVTAPSGYAVNPIKTPLLFGGRLINPDASVQGNSQRFAGRSPLEALAGPSAGILGDTALAAGAGIDVIAGEEEIKQSKINAARRIVPYQSYIGMREMLQYLTDDSPYAGE